LKNGIPLYRPSSEQVALHDPPFSYVLESRRSNRAHNQSRPIAAETLGEFLFRAARNRYHYTTEIGTFTSRPYPSGGGSYELELYLTINQCSGLQRGFYYYDPEHHSISLIESPNEDMERMLYDAWISSARSCWPQVLITIASRFQRVSWKYSGMAYATQLKNTGVLFQTLYLVATAMNLAACGLGLGNTARFCKLAQTDFFAEGSIGEFMLGSSA
jgi:SagB-type dehydrogenase family enzyme